MPTFSSPSPKREGVMAQGIIKNDSVPASLPFYW